MNWDFSGRVALVTGGSRGIGLAIASTIVRGGGRAMLVGRDEEAMDAALAVLGERAAGEIAGVEVPGAADRVVQATLERFGRLDHLVNNAGLNMGYTPLQEADLASVDAVWSVTVRAPLEWTQVAWRRWMRAHGGAIVNIASTGGLMPVPMAGAYSVGKRH